MSEAVTNWFLQQGALGVFCLLLIAVVIWQARQNEKDAAAVREENSQLRAYIRDLQEKRIAEITSVVNVSAKAMSDFSARGGEILSLASKNLVQR